MARVLAIFLFVGLAAENYADVPFEGRWETIFRPLGELLYRASPVKAPTIAVLLLGLLWLARSKPGARTARVIELDRALWLNLGALSVTFLYGMLRGGSLLPAMLQAQVLLFLPFAGFLFIAGLQTEADFRMIAKAILYAALYRGFLVFYFGLVVAPSLGVSPMTMTTHGDTLLFSLAIVMVVSWALEEGTRAAYVRALPLLAYLIAAVHINNRRLAYVSIGASILLLYVLFDNPAFKRRLNRALLVALPLVALYVVSGWGSESPIFKPVKAISTMVGDKQDASSQTRDIENYNLILTLKPNIIMGRGFGHQYDEVSVGNSISEVFPIYRYIPHNAVLGIWAFAGGLGATAWWLCLVVAAFLSLRAYGLSATPLARSVSAVSACQVVIYMLQGYGDMGLGSWNGVLQLGVAFAGASRLAAATGAHPAPGVVLQAEELESTDELGVDAGQDV